MTAVFAFQFFGCEYQPPAGDQTCLGYLQERSVRSVLAVLSHGMRVADYTRDAIGRYVRDLSASAHGVR